MTSPPAVPRRLAAVLAAVLAAASLVLGGASPAAAHEADPRIVTTLTAVEPPLASQVVLQVQAGIATQLVADNPTATVLEVIGTAGRPFLRMSSAGVFADVANEEFFTTANPTGAAPTGAGDKGPPRWVQISRGTSWGWYDHRLHPDEVGAPADDDRPARLADFEVPFRYGATPVAVRGTVDFRPLLGAFLVSADPAPQGLQVQALPGRLPALFLSAPSGVPVTVLGRDGEPFLRMTDAGVEVNTHSRTHVEDRQARGELAGPPSPTPAFVLVAPGASSYTWLDARLRYPEDLPPPDVLRAGEPTVVQEWDVPVEIAGDPAALGGDVTWVPEPDAAARVGASVAEEPEPSLLPYVLGSAAAAVLVAAVLLLRRGRRAQPAG